MTHNFNNSILLLCVKNKLRNYEVDLKKIYDKPLNSAFYNTYKLLNSDFRDVDNIKRIANDFDIFLLTEKYSSQTNKKILTSTESTFLFQLSTREFNDFLYENNLTINIYSLDSSYYDVDLYNLAENIKLNTDKIAVTLGETKKPVFIENIIQPLLPVNNKKPPTIYEICNRWVKKCHFTISDDNNIEQLDIIDSFNVLLDYLDKTTEEDDKELFLVRFGCKKELCKFDFDND